MKYVYFARKMWWFRFEFPTPTSRHGQESNALLSMLHNHLLFYYVPERRKLRKTLSSELELCVKQRNAHPRPTVSLWCGYVCLMGSSFKVRILNPRGFSVPLQVYSILLVLSSTGTFYSREKLQNVFEFVRQSLVSDWQPFLLFEAGRQLKDENATLVDLGLVSKKRHFQKVRFDYVYFLSSLL